MDNRQIETGEVVQLEPEAVDILNSRYRIHWTLEKRLQRIISMGIFSKAFAQRISYELPDSRGLGSGDYTHSTRLSEDMNEVLPAGLGAAASRNLGELVGVVFEPKIPSQWDDSRRIAPRRFVGVVIPDRIPEIYRNGRFPRSVIDSLIVRQSLVSKRVNRVAKLLETQSGVNHLSIYGLSGDSLWPKKMSHEEIVQMKGRQT